MHSKPEKLQGGIQSAFDLTRTSGRVVINNKPIEIPFDEHLLRDKVRFAASMVVATDYKHPLAISELESIASNYAIIMPVAYKNKEAKTLDEPFLDMQLINGKYQPKVTAYVCLVTEIEQQYGFTYNSNGEKHFNTASHEKAFQNSMNTFYGLRLPFGNDAKWFKDIVADEISKLIEASLLDVEKMPSLKKYAKKITKPETK